MFRFGVGVKDSPNFKISISSWVSCTFDTFKILVDCGFVVSGSSGSFLVITVNLAVSIRCVFSTYFNKLPISFEYCSSKCVSFNLLNCSFQLFTFLASSSSLTLHLVKEDEAKNVNDWKRKPNKNANLENICKELVHTLNTIIQNKGRSAYIKKSIRFSN